ncbi:Uncharacterised protein [uncultured Butyricicoccus sp.]|nr:Uncharacterised protein [uncultured Butyricicoccus sp.]
MWHQIEYYFVVLRLSDMPCVDGVWNIGQLDAMPVIIILYLGIRYRLVYDAEAYNITTANHIAVIRSHTKVKLRIIRYLVSGRVGNIYIAQLQFHLHMAPCGFQYHIAGGHRDNLSGVVVRPFVRAAYHVPAAEAAAGVHQPLAAGDGNGRSHKLLDGFRRASLRAACLEDHFTLAAVNDHLRQGQRHAVECAVVKYAGVQAAVGVVGRSGDAAALNHFFLCIDLWIEFHFQHKINVRLSAYMLQMHVDAVAVRRGGSGHVNIGAVRFIVAVFNCLYHGLIPVQMQGKINIVIVVMHHLFQIGPHFIPENGCVRGSVCRHNVSAGGMGLAVVGGVFRQHLIRLVRELPCNERVALSQLARQGF